MKQHAASGELHLSGVGKAERGEVLRVLRNEEERAREKNPLGRIMRMEADGEHWKVETTTEKLVQRLGRRCTRREAGESLTSGLTTISLCA